MARELLSSDRFPERVTGMPVCDCPDRGITVIYPSTDEGEDGTGENKMTAEKMVEVLQGGPHITSEIVKIAIQGLLQIGSLSLARQIRSQQQDPFTPVRAVVKYLHARAS
ncbi:MAG: hypothetical protein Q7S44_02510 [bacterium]|nr:hypothetical protein [bacterium]